MNEQELVEIDERVRGTAAWHDVTKLIREVRRLQGLVEIARQGFADLNTRIGAAIALTKDEPKSEPMAEPCCNCDA